MDDEKLTREEREIMQGNDPKVAQRGQKVERRRGLKSEQEGADNLDPPVAEADDDILSTGRLARGD